MVLILLSSWFPVPVQVHFDLVPDQIALVDIPGVHEIVPDSLLSYILDDVFLLYLVIQPEAPEVRGGYPISEYMSAHAVDTLEHSIRVPLCKLSYLTAFHK